MGKTDKTVTVPLPPHPRHRERRHVKGLRVRVDHDRQELVLVLDVEGKGGEELPLRQYSLSHKAAVLLRQDLRAGLEEYLGTRLSED